MELINQYFDGIIFTKVELKEEYTLYVALLNHGNNKFAIALVRNHLAILRQAELKDLTWACIQTRTLAKRYNLKSQTMKRTKLPTPLFLESERTDTSVKYRSQECPLEILLINDSKKKGVYQYPKHYNVLAAVLSYNCVITPIDITESIHSTPANNNFRGGNQLEVIAQPD
jgi:hypothetical protein